MITLESLEKLGRQYQMGVFPNIVREYFQHLFLSELYKLPGSEKMLFKGGTALRIVYNSPRFSEDLDFSVFEIQDIKSYVESLFIKALDNIEKSGIKVDLGPKVGPTSGGYFGLATFKMYDYLPARVEINVSSRDGGSMEGEVDSIANDFVPAYTIVHMPQSEIINEKIFGALIGRSKPRDFYDLYFIMRSKMLSTDQKSKLAAVKSEILDKAASLDFKSELGAFLPADQQNIVRDFARALNSELERQLAV